MSDTTDIDDEFAPSVAERFLDPAVLAAHHLMKRALGAHGGILGVQGRLVLVEASQEWLEPLASALTDGRPAIVTLEHRRPPFTVARDTSRVQHALREGRAAYILTHDPDVIPKEFAAAADMRILLPEVDAAALAHAAGVSCGEPPPALDAPPPGITPGMLHMARRKGQSARDYAARVAALAEAARPAPPPRPPGLEGLHGMDTAVAWGRGLASDLRAYRTGELAWSDVDRGCMLSGPPGCGKTTFARRLAAECGVPLVATSYGEWQSSGGGYLGDVTKAICETFKRARASAPCILFIDELDSVQSRGSSSRHDDWWTAIINTLLAELDGVEGREGVVVIGASNFAERVDAAIRRSGRLDREIRIGLPGVEALALILRGYLGEDLGGADMRPFAIRALGGTGADCERWVRGARRRARHAGREMAAEDLLAEIRGGPGREHPPEVRARVAAHEAGHVVAYAVARPGSILSASIRGEGPVAGGVHVIGEEEFSALPGEIHARLVCRLSGRAAEEVVLGEAGGGCGGLEDSDLAEATHVATLAELSFGLGTTLAWHGAIPRAEVGGVLLARPEVAARVECRLQAAYAEALALVRERRIAVEAVAGALLERETMSGAELASVVAAAERRRASARGPEAPPPDAAVTRRVGGPL